MARAARVFGWLVLVLLIYRAVTGGGSILIPALDPIPGEGFRVLMVYESEQLKDYPTAQVSALYSAQVRDYLDAKCVKGESDWPDYRILDQDADVSMDSAWWQAAMKRPRQSLPWLVIDSPQGGFEGPMPASTSELLTLLKKYGGE